MDDRVGQGFSERQLDAIEVACNARQPSHQFHNLFHRPIEHIDPALDGAMKLNYEVRRCFARIHWNRPSNYGRRRRALARPANTSPKRNQAVLCLGDPIASGVLVDSGRLLVSATSQGMTHYTLFTDRL